ncbi:MAG: MBL fold metallo-hydrolase [Balneola sp.]|nr:MBL fold metallo-hydrolase [Balneola sp.]MBO6650505.1 MBL fold metallo-hydrolase [Balneola sp.]MBO6711502.1 MBL fold metallo-hydrolase [Balneola sp.]MBO6799698.1 MBL fold metallo-hydrolase [Balneola sp.]MBO6870861.1 MBL fold metallo-hydrolase [Balneola sp.]
MRYGGNTSCIQISVPGMDEFLIADCGTGFRNLGNELDSNGKSLMGKIFITHPHWDHLQGFPFFKPFYDSKNCFEVYMPPQDGVGCKEILQGHLSNTFFPVSIDMLESELDCITFEKAKLDFAEYSVEFMWANHTVPTAIYKFTINGIVIIFAPDNELPINIDSDNKAFVDEFRAFVKGANVLIHDAQFTKEQHEQRLGWGHSNWETVIDLTKDLGIRRLCLTHHDPDHSDDTLDRINSKIASIKSSFYEEATVIQEGQELYLPN